MATSVAVSTTPSSTLPQPAPATVAAQPAGYPQPAPLPGNSGVVSYSAQPLFAAQPPGYGPLAPPPQINGAPPISPPPNWQPPYLPMPPGPTADVPVRPRRARLTLPEMVYLVAPKFWFRPDVLLWDTKAAPLPQPIVTLGSTADALPGALGQPGTQVVVGGGNVNFGYVGGIRLETGVWLDERRIVGLEAGYFVLIQQSRELSNQSDLFGNPVIARPTIDARSGAEGAYLDSFPGQFVGGVNVILRSEFQGANLDSVLNLVQTNCLRLDGLLGFRYLSLAESLNIYDQSTDFLGGNRTFGGAPVGTFDVLAPFDSFRVTNSFYGGSGGARVYYARGRWYFSALGKAALGTVQQRATVTGSTTYTDQHGTQTTLPGGILATTANMGSYYQSPHAVAPEGQFNLGYQMTPSVTVRIGYSFIYLSNVARPGNQVNRVTSANLVPSDPAFGAASPNPPAFQFHTSTYWAQGLNLGCDVRF